MAEPTPSCESSDPIEKEFRKKNLWYSFASQAYGALGMASFFAALGTLAGGLISVATKVPALANGMPTASAALVSGPLPFVVMGGLIAAGLTFTYMSQRAATELKCVQDTHMAYQNAKQQTLGKAPAQAQTVEYEQNQRADGKQWQQVLNIDPAAARQLH